jgi:AraC-like DNA-binding protein
VEALRRREGSALIIDPGLLDEAAFEAALAELAEARTPVLLYGKLSAHTARRIVRAEREGAVELVLRGVDDAPEVMARKLAAVRRPEPSTILLSLLAPRIAELPEPLQTAVVPLFCGAPVPRWVNELADAAGLARRTLDRRMKEDAELRGSAALLDAARLARVWEPLVEERWPLGDVARTLGFGQQRVLVSHVRRLLRVSPGELGVLLTRERFAAQLARTVVRR